jgi:hypothetical protein
MDAGKFLISSTTGISPGAVASPLVSVTPQTIRERVDDWWLTPLARMDGHEGFVCLALCLPLLERVVRFNVNADDKDDFSEGSKLVKRLAKLLAPLSQEDAHDFWQMFRNGIAHRAMPRLYKKRTYELAANQKVPVRAAESHFIIDPQLLRDLVIKLVNQNRKMWHDEDYPLAVVYRKTID